MSFINRSHWQGALTLVCMLLLASCNDSDSGSPGVVPPVVMPSVVGLTQTAATSTLTGLGLVIGTVTMQSSATVPVGSVIGQSPAAGVIVAPASAVNLTVSSGPVAVPNVVGLTPVAATAALTGAGLVLGTVTMTSSPTVPKGSVISQSPAAATLVATGTAVNLSVSVGPPASFAYVSNAGDGTISAYSINAAGQLAALAPSAMPVPGSKQLYENKIDPSGKFLYVLDDSSPGGVYGFAIQGDGSLMAMNGGVPFAAGNTPQALAFDASGGYLFVLNAGDDSISAFSLDPSGVLTALATYPITQPNPNPQPEQMVGAGNFLYVAEYATNTVEVFTITAGGVLTEGVVGSPFATDTGPYSLAVDPTGSVLYTANIGSNGSGSISAFTLNSSGVLAPVGPAPLAIPVVNTISIDPQSKFLFVTETDAVAVYPITLSTGMLGAAVAGPPFVAGSNPYSISIDNSDQFVYVGNDGTANVSEFMLDSSSGELTMQGSPVGAGNNPDFIAIH